MTVQSLSSISDKDIAELRRKLDIAEVAFKEAYRLMPSERANSAEGLKQVQTCRHCLDAFVAGRNDPLVHTVLHKYTALKNLIAEIEETALILREVA